MQWSGRRPPASRCCAPAPPPGLGSHENGRQAAFHVDGAQAVEHAVFDLPGEGIVTPVRAPEHVALPVAGVRMAAEHQGRSAAVAAQRADGLMRAAAPGQRDFLQFHLEVPLAQPVRQPEAQLRFLPEEGGNADQLLRQRYGFVGLQVRQQRSGVHQDKSGSGYEGLLLREWAGRICYRVSICLPAGFYRWPVPAATMKGTSPGVRSGPHACLKTSSIRKRGRRRCRK